MRHLLLIAIVLSVILISGCAPSVETETPAQAAPVTPSRLAGPAPGQKLLGSADAFKISLKQYSAHVETIAKENFPQDACLISVFGEYPSQQETGKASLWHYKYYSKSQNRAIVVDADVRETAGKLLAYGSVKPVKVFKKEPYKPCIQFSQAVDSTDAGKSVNAQNLAGISLEYDTDTEGSPNLVYAFTTSAGEIKVSGVTGQALV